MEYIVVADLLLKQYEVFRATTTSCSCDIVILKDKILKLVEVTAGHRSIIGKLSWSKTCHPTHRYDILSLVLPDKSIVYLDQAGIEITI